MIGWYVAFVVNQYYNGRDLTLRAGSLWSSRFKHGLGRAQVKRILGPPRHICPSSCPVSFSPVFPSKNIRLTDGYYL